MDSSSQEEERKIKITEVQTFPVPFPLKKNQENRTINTPSTPSKEQIINQAFKFHSQRNILEATKYYQYFINQGFKDHRVFSNYGGILRDLGKLKEAELSYRKAIEINPDYAEAHYNLGNTLKDLGKLKEAELSTRKAIELKPDFAEAHLNLGVVLKDHGKLQDAELSYRKAIEIKPDFAEAHYNLGIGLKRLGKLQDAELSYRKAIEIKPDFAEAYSNLGTILIDLGNIQDAEFSYRKAIEIKPDFAEAHLNLSRIENKSRIDMDFIQNIDTKYKKNCLKNLSLSKSQFRQDLFALSQLHFKKNGFFVEFGSCDGVVGSNSYLLEKHFDWDGILAEPAIYWHNKLQENRSVNIETKCVWKSSGQEILFNEPVSNKGMASITIFSDENKEYSMEANKYKVQTISLFDLLEKYQAPKTIDYLSIDTEGSEYEILKAFDFDKYKFRVITCEHNFSPIREKIYDLLMNKGYTRKSTHISRVDDWYVFAE